MHFLCDCRNIQHIWKLISTCLKFELARKHIIIGFYDEINSKTILLNTCMLISFFACRIYKLELKVKMRVDRILGLISRQHFFFFSQQFLVKIETNLEISLNLKVCDVLKIYIVKIFLKLHCINCYILYCHCVNKWKNIVVLCEYKSERNSFTCYIFLLSSMVSLSLLNSIVLLAIFPYCLAWYLYPFWMPRTAAGPSIPSAASPTPRTPGDTWTYPIRPSWCSLYFPAAPVGPGSPWVQYWPL